MKKIFGLIVLFFPAALLAAPLDFHKGMALPLYDRNPHADYRPSIAEIRSLGADHVSVVFELYMDQSTSSEVYADPVLTPNLNVLERVIREIHAQGMQVMLFPIIILKKKMPYEWRGNIHPSDKRAWFHSYQRLLSQYLLLAEKHHIAYFSIGSELCSMEREFSLWLSFIHNTRKIYSGRLIYSANWDHYQEVSFWDAVDYVGVTGYWGLTLDNEPTLRGLKHHLKKAQKDLLSWQETLSKPFLFTEVGYLSRNGTNQTPWDSKLQGSIDSWEQYLCHRAFYEVWHGVSQVKGIYFWHWFGAGGIADGSYTPRGKPAVEVVLNWYEVP